MKLGFGRVLVWGIAFGAGQELGRLMSMTGIRLLTKRTMEEAKLEYRRRMAATREEERVRRPKDYTSGIRAVADEGEIRDVKYPNDPQD